MNLPSIRIMKKRIYVADDEENIRQVVKMFLESEGYLVEAFANGDDLYDAFQKKESDLVILDIMMPGRDGLTICNLIRQDSAVPIILLTAKDSDGDQIAGISLGSDDYLTKPFSPSILNIRVKALLRRVEMWENQNKNETELKCGDLFYTSKKHGIFLGDKELELTTMELACLLHLMNRFQEAVSREELLDKVWGYDTAVETRVTDETIRRIRRKLESAGSKVAILNKWGYGYILQEK